MHIELTNDQVQRVLQDLALVDRQGLRAAADRPCSAEALWTVTDRIRITLAEGNPAGEFTRAREAHDTVRRREALNQLATKGILAQGCGCACNSGGFCGGCGHAGCGRR